MVAFRSIRVQMPDRPGALSTLSTALAAHAVDIVRFDVVSSDGDTVIDDLYLSAPSQEMIGSAIASFRPDVLVRTFESEPREPARVLADGLIAAASAVTTADAAAATAEGARLLARADVAALLRATPSGNIEVLAGPEGLPDLAASDPFAGWWVLEKQSAIAFRATAGLRWRGENEAWSWAPAHFQQALSSAWLTLTPCGPTNILLTGRTLNIAYYAGELARLQAYADGVASVLQLRGEVATDVPTRSGAGQLPPRAVIFGAAADTHLPVRI